MHFEFLIEDRSGKILLDSVLRKFIDRGSASFTCRVHSYRGAGHIPRDLKSASDPSRRILLDRLPKLLAGYSKAPGIDAVFVVTDLDQRRRYDFLRSLEEVARQAGADHLSVFCLAIEEVEAWLLGDQQALLKAFPHARRNVLRNYEQDSICGTWEVLADSIHRGGSRALQGLPYSVVGRLKCEWSEKIAQEMQIDRNLSPSFNAFLNKLSNRVEEARK